MGVGVFAGVEVSTVLVIAREESQSNVIHARNKDPKAFFHGFFQAGGEEGGN
jgi:hypothetical protein